MFVLPTPKSAKFLTARYLHHLKGTKLLLGLFYTFLRPHQPVDKIKKCVKKQNEKHVNCPDKKYFC
jgi:hypothetical protein